MQPLDVEQSAPILRRRLANDDHDTSSQPRVRPSDLLPNPPPGLPARHPLNIMKRSSIIGGTVYILHDKLNLFHNILHHPLVSHTWFKVGIAGSITVMGLKAYVELYEGKRQGKAVEYENFKTATHATILFILLSWISFHVALSPVYGMFKTWLIMVGFGWGVLIQAALFIPVWIQNAISFVLLTFFLSVYK